jgi:hypothetical protein
VVAGRSAVVLSSICRSWCDQLRVSRPHDRAGRSAITRARVAPALSWQK